MKFKLKNKIMYKKAYYRRIPAYFNIETSELAGRNFFYNTIIDIMIWIDTYIIEVDEYPIYIEDND